MYGAYFKTRIPCKWSKKYKYITKITQDLKKSILQTVSLKCFQLNQISENRQVNLIVTAKLGCHLRSRSVQFFNILGIIKNKLWDHRIVWWFCSQIFFAHFGASFASSSASATPKGDPGLRSGLRSLRSYIRYENLSKNHQKSWISQLFLRSPMLKNWRTGSHI